MLYNNFKKDEVFIKPIIKSISQKEPIIHAKTIKIWVPANTSDHDKQSYISNYYENVINNENYIYKESTISTWIWFPKM